MASTKSSLEFSIKAKDLFSSTLKKATSLFGGLAQAEQQTEQQTSELSRKLKSLNGSLAGVDKLKAMRLATHEMGKSSKTAALKVASFEKAMRGVGAPTKQLTAEYKKAKETSARLAKSYSNQKEKLGKLGKELRAAGIDTSALKKSQDGLQDQLLSTKKAIKAESDAILQAAKSAKKATTANTKLSKSTRLLQTAMGGVKSAASKLKTPLAIIGTVATLGFYKALGSARKFQTTMSEVAAISGATGKDLVDLTNKAKEMGKKTRFSASEAAEGLKALAQAGLSPKQAMDALEPSLLLAQAGSIELGEAADYTTNIMSQFGMEAKDLGGIVDQLAVVASNSNTGISDLALALQYSGGIGKAAGQNLSEMNAVLAVMADAGFKGEKAGTSLRGALSSLLKPAKAAREEIKRLGLKTHDSAGKMLPFGDILKQLKSKGADATSILKLFGREAGSGIAAAMNKSIGRLDEFREKIDHSSGSAKKMADTMDNNMDGAFKRFGSALEGFTNDVILDFSPAIIGATDGVTDFIRGLSAKATASALKDFGYLVLGAGETLKEAFGDTWNFLKTNLTAPWDYVNSWFANKTKEDSLLGGVFRKIKSGFSAVGDYAEKATDTLIETGKKSAGAVEKTRKAVKDLAEEIKKPKSLDVKTEKAEKNTSKFFAFYKKSSRDANAEIIHIKVDERDAIRKADKAKLKIDNVRQRTVPKIQAKDDTKPATTSAQRNISSVKQHRPTVIRADDRTYPQIIQVKRNINSIPRSHNTNLNARVTGSSSTYISNVASQMERVKRAGGAVTLSARVSYYSKGGSAGGSPSSAKSKPVASYKTKLPTLKADQYLNKNGGLSLAGFSDRWIYGNHPGSKPEMVYNFLRNTGILSRQSGHSGDQYVKPYAEQYGVRLDTMRDMGFRLNNYSVWNARDYNDKSYVKRLHENYAKSRGLSLMPFSGGGYARKYSDGGFADPIMPWETGQIPGYSRVDTIPAYLTEGEFITNAQSARAINGHFPGLMDMLNSVGSADEVRGVLGYFQGYTNGGTVGVQSTPASRTPPRNQANITIEMPDVNISVSSLDSADLEKTFRAKIIPKLKQAISSNTQGVATTIQRKLNGYG
ncbi:MAG: phage tail tape measure protein [Magnetococcales bacterium]|nr:phage tail tape measure protein [Magnetococcales bacterium]